jgi:hypothetical protein
MRLYPAPSSNCYTALDLNERPDEAIVPNRAAVEVHRLNQRDASTKTNVDDT